MAEELPKLETEFDRRKMYRELRLKGMSDFEAKEKVWPSTTAGLNINIKEKADKKEKEDKERADKAKE